MHITIPLKTEKYSEQRTIELSIKNGRNNLLIAFNNHSSEEVNAEELIRALKALFPHLF